MSKYLNTLFVTTQGAYLAKEGETVVVSVEYEKRLTQPVHTLDGIVCFGQVGASPALLAYCAEQDVAVSFLTENGRFLAKLAGPVSGNVLLRKSQFRATEDPVWRLELARCIVAGKLVNSRTALRRAARDHGGEEDLASAADTLTHMMTKAERGPDLDALRGLEGESAHVYFSVFDRLVRQQREDFSFAGRSRRPPLDRINCLLSFMYTLLAHDVRSALESVGLDSQVGFLHADRPGRPSLALDLMEEMRPYLADRLVLSLINRSQISAKGFKQSESGAVLMDDDTRKAVLVAYQTRKREEVEHPFLREKMPLGHVFFIQALLLARHLRGDLDGYPPFIWR